MGENTSAKNNILLWGLARPSSPKMGPHEGPLRPRGALRKAPSSPKLGPQGRHALKIEGRGARRRGEDRRREVGEGGGGGGEGGGGGGGGGGGRGAARQGGGEAHISPLPGNLEVENSTINNVWFVESLARACVMSSNLAHLHIAMFMQAIAHKATCLRTSTSAVSYDRSAF
eukprot:1232163-Pyramimonas_sp.AAC.1